jgi:hypothetical protein
MSDPGAVWSFVERLLRRYRQRMEMTVALDSSDREACGRR